MLEIKEFSGKCQEILDLADVYMRSYNELSNGYKTREEWRFIPKARLFAN